MIKPLLVIAIISLSALCVTAQNAVDAAFSKGDVDALSVHLAPKIELSILDKESTHIKDEVIVILRDFFAQNDVKGFRRKHTGASKGQESNYTIGQLATGNGAFRIYLYFDVKDDARLISEIRIEHPN